MSKIKFGIMGSDYSAGIIVDGYLDDILHGYELVGILGHTPHKTATIVERGRCRTCFTVGELLALEPGIVMEAASVQYVRDNVQKVLSAGVNLTVLSIGAFVDEVLYDKIKETAIRYNSKVHTVSGAVDGFDVPHTISLMDQAKSGIRTKKSPISLMNTPLYDDDLMTEEEESHVFSSNAKEAISTLPTKVSVAAVASLAATGPKDTSVNIFSVPGVVGDDYRITMETDGVKATMDIYSNTSTITGQSMVAVLKNPVSPIVLQDALLRTEGTRQIRRIN